MKLQLIRGGMPGTLQIQPVLLYLLPKRKLVFFQQLDLDGELIQTLRLLSGISICFRLVNVRDGLGALHAG